jgi:hypothetical protein
MYSGKTWLMDFSLAHAKFGSLHTTLLILLSCTYFLFPSLLLSGSKINESCHLYRTAVLLL